MPRAAASKDWKTFTGGLITEATGLSYPDNACRDLDNVDIELSGRIRRRLGLDGETDWVWVDGTEDATDGSTSAVTAWIWKNPDNISSLNFLVVQSGEKLLIFNMDQEPVSSNLVAEIDFSTAFVPPKSSSGGLFSGQTYEEKIQGVSGRGYFYFTSPRITPRYLSYDTGTETVTLNTLSAYPAQFTEYLAVRDFKGVEDDRPIELRVETDKDVEFVRLGLGFYAIRVNSFNPDDWPQNYIYNIVNQGWFGRRDVEDTIFGLKFLPALSDVRIANRDVQNISPSYAPRGNIVLDFITGNRNNIFYARWDEDQDVGQNENWALPSDTFEPMTAGFKTCEFFAGRLWLAGAESTLYPNQVMFSKLIQREEDAAIFMQEASPTDAREDSALGSDIIDTDGGVIQIAEAGDILRLVAYNDGLLVFCSNGVWFIRGDEGGFKATAYSVDLLTNDGCVSAFGVVRSDEGVYYVAETGINRIGSPGGQQALGQIVIESLSDERIKTYYQNLPAGEKKGMYASYDKSARRVSWLHREANSYSDFENQSVYNRLLVWDVRVGCFYKYSFDEVDNGTQLYAVGAAFNLTPSTVTISTEDVVDGVDLVLDGVEQVVVPLYTSAPLQSNVTSSLRLILVKDQTAGGAQDVTIGKFHQDTFLDWASISGTGVNYSSYLEPGDQTLDELQRYKQATYVHSFFDRTETAIDSINPTVFDNPSGCLMRAKWDWHSSANGGRWSDPQQAYRFRRPVLSPAVGAFDNGESIVYSKLKARGKGRAMRLRYESEQGKDFRLLGFSVAFTANGI